MRQVRPTLGEIFWAYPRVPRGYEAPGWKTYLAMDSITQADVTLYWSRLVNTTPADDKYEPNERSLYALPSDPRTLVLLMRTGGSSLDRLLASTCRLPNTHSLPLPAPVPAYSQCRPGTGNLNFALVPTANRTCLWSDPVFTSIPDSHSRTCASALPDGRIYLLGAQLTRGRDPLTLALSKDGLAFDKVWAVRSQAPPIRFPGP